MKLIDLSNKSKTLDMILCGEITNDDLRDYLKENHITNSTINIQHIRVLQSLLSIELKESGKFRGSYCMDSDITAGLKYFALTCSSDYFEKREAVTFNTDGFVGMAGWADSKNIIPIRVGVYKWAKQIVDLKEQEYNMNKEITDSLSIKAKQNVMDLLEKQRDNIQKTIRKNTYEINRLVEEQFTKKRELKELSLVIKSLSE